MEKEVKISLKLIFGFLAFVLGLHFFGTIYHWYWTYPWFDMPMHFLGGFWVAMVYFWINAEIGVSDSCLCKVPKWLVDLLFISSFIVLIGVFWEFFEFSVDFFIGKVGTFQGNSADTLGDLVFDLLGGAAAFAIFYKKTLK